MLQEVGLCLQLANVTDANFEKFGTVPLQLALPSALLAQCSKDDPLYLTKRHFNCLPDQGLP